MFFFFFLWVALPNLPLVSNSSKSSSSSRATCFATSSYLSIFTDAMMTLCSPLARSLYRVSLDRATSHPPPLLISNVSERDVSCTQVLWGN